MSSATSLLICEVIADSVDWPGTAAKLGGEANPSSKDTDAQCFSIPRSSSSLQGRLRWVTKLTGPNRQSSVESDVCKGWNPNACQGAPYFELSILSAASRVVVIGKQGDGIGG
jgi:hypothetical protein